MCRDTGRRAEAEPLYERAIAIGEKTLGSDSRELAIRLYNVPGDLELFRRLHNFALLYHQDGRRAEAEPLYERAITVLRKILASLEDVLDRQEPPKPIELMGYPEPASLLGYMGIIYYDAGRPLEAEPFLKRAVEIDGQLHGPVRVGVGSRCYKLGKLYYDTGRYAEAEPLLRRALKIGEKGLGPEHPLLSTNLDTLAALYRDTGRLAEAERLEERTAAIKRRAATAGRPPP